MVYALTISVLSLAILIYALTRKKEREFFCEKYDDDEYEKKCKEFISSMPLPKETSQIRQTTYKRNIKYVRFLIGRKKYKGSFSDFLQDSSLVDGVLKADLSKLTSTPSVACDGAEYDNGKTEPRIVKIARFCLAHNDYEFSQDRFLSAVNAQNKARTLTFEEILFFKEAFLYVLLEKLNYLYNDLHILCKVYALAQKYCKNPNIAIFDKRYKSYIKSKLFLSLCAIAASYSDSSFAQNFREVTDALFDVYVRVMNSWQRVLNFDFSKYYSPLEIYDKFDVFANASERCKENFLKCASEISDKENIDEFMFAIRLEKLMSSASGGHIKVRRFNAFSRLVCIFSQKRDIAMLAVALSSQYFMDLSFNHRSQKINKSISKMFDFENTFEPIYKFQSLNFGISTSGGRLKISPHLPRQILSADIVFEENDTKNYLKIQRGDENALYLGNTKLSGTSQIKLSNKPLDILVVIDDENKNG